MPIVYDPELQYVLHLKEQQLKKSLQRQRWQLKEQ
jgi:hypothetical protein